MISNLLTHATAIAQQHVTASAGPVNFKVLKTTLGRVVLTFSAGAARAVDPSPSQVATVGHWVAATPKEVLARVKSRAVVYAVTVVAADAEALAVFPAYEMKISHQYERD